ncbi:MAG: JAB domain-containing protein [Geminicoccaceae bacterium]
MNAGKSTKAAGAAAPHYHGHRKRLRARFMNGEGAALPDYELLEMLLFFSIRYVDVKPLAKCLLETFGSLGGVLAAEPARLDHVMQSIASNEGVQIEKDAYFTITHLKAMRQLLERVLAEEVKQRPVISSWQALLDYLKVALGHEPIEQFRLLFLDKKNILIEDRSSVQPSSVSGETSAQSDSWKYVQAFDDVQQRGTVDHTPLYPREIAKRALELGASALIMVHNHPSGDPTPSRADIEMTKQVEAALAPIRVALHDHLIIGKDRHLSFKSEGLI